VRIRPNEAHRFAEFLQPRASLAVRGEGIETLYGRVVKAREIGTDLNNFRPTARNPDSDPCRRLPLQ
jgi:hypothetical protein